MKRKFCPKCGKETDELYGNLCEECFLKNFKMKREIPDRLIVKTCKSCGKVFMGEEKFEGVEKAIEDFLQNILKEKEIKSVNYRIYENKIFLTINFEIGRLEKKEVKEMGLIAKTFTCKYCNLQQSKYFMTTLQLRVPKYYEDKLIHEIENQTNALNKFDNYAFISGIEKIKGGWNIYLGSKRAAEQVIKYLKQKYDVKTKTSYTQHGIVGGKKTYRETILISMGD